jgi:type I restriction enzyme S subunit
LKRYRVGDVLRLERRGVLIDPLAEYRLIGVYSFGKGIFHREPTLGADLGNYRFFRVVPGDLVLSNIQAWEKAIGYATERDAGCVGTHRFLTYVPRNGLVDTNYLRYLFLSDRGFRLIQKASPGSVTRNRTLAIDRFEDLEIEVPPIEVQRVVASELDAANGCLHAAQQAMARGEGLLRHLVDAGVESFLAAGSGKSNWRIERLGDVAEINPSPVPVDSEAIVAFVPMAAIDQITGSIIDVEHRPARDVRSGYKQFRAADVIFARITPCMQNGKAAVVEGLGAEIGYGSTEFHVIRPSDSVEPRWIHRIVRTRAFREAAALRFTGTAGQQRVPADYLRGANIPVPRTREEQRVALRELDHILTNGQRLSELRSGQRVRIQALERSLLNRAFAVHL